METLNTLIRLFLDEKLSAEKFADSFFEFYYNTGYFKEVTGDLKERLDLLALTINMLETPENIDDGLVHITEQGLRKQVKREWGEVA